MNENGVTLDLGKAWNDAMALMRANKEIILILGGLFIFLPSLLVTIIAGDPPVAPTADPDAMSDALLGWLGDNSIYFLISSLVTMLGTLAILFVSLNPAKPTVGEAISLAGGMLIFYLIQQILASFAVGLGMILLIVPGIYFAVKFSLSGMVAAGESQRNPIEMMRRSWQLTKGNSLRLFGLYLLVGIAALVAMLVISLIIGGILGMILPDGASAPAIAIVDTVLQTALSLVILHVSMAAYRQLSGAA